VATPGVVTPVLFIIKVHIKSGSLGFKVLHSGATALKVFLYYTSTFNMPKSSAAVAEAELLQAWSLLLYAALLFRDLEVSFYFCIFFAFINKFFPISIMTIYTAHAK
jgi:hypothetical protein